MRLLIDLDGVCADVYTPWLAAYNLEYNDSLTEADINVWELSALVKPECGEKIQEYLNLPRLFAKLDMYPNADAVLKRLQDAGHEIVFVTACPEIAETAYFDKLCWVREKFPFVPRKNFISTSSKFMVRGDLMLDDGEHNINAFPGITVAMDKPWNRLAKATYRVGNWLEFEKVVNGIYDRKLRG
jgi:5'(3')-deoxyribonucleotidase